MTTINAFNIAFNLCALIIVLIMLIAELMQKRREEPVFKWFFYLVLFAFLGMMCEVTIGFLAHRPGDLIRALCTGIDYLGYLFASFQFLAIAVYFYEYLRLKTNVTKRVFYLMIAYNIANIILITIAQANGMFAIYDELNRYQQQDLFWLSQVFPILTSLTSMLVAFIYARQLTAKELFLLLICPLFPLVCYVMDALVDGLWISYIGIALQMLLMYITLQMENIKKFEQQEAEMEKARISVMLSQIQPHFLCNALNAIADLCYIDHVEASKAIVTFSSYLRNNLDSLSKKEMIGFNEELNHVRQYLKLEQLRFEERLQVLYDIHVYEFLIPALTLQAITENAVRYGVSKKPQGGCIWIRAIENEDYYKVSVSDDGVGFDSSDVENIQDGRSHTGIKNVKDRLAAICGGELNIISMPNQGTTAEIKIPKVNIHRRNAR